jgi:hypothetical protein
VKAASPGCEAGGYFKAFWFFFFFFFFIGLIQPPADPWGRSWVNIFCSVFFTRPPTHRTWVADSGLYFFFSFLGVIKSKLKSRELDNFYLSGISMVCR